MRVTVIDRAAMARAWGTGPFTIITRELEIADTCPVCGGPRGQPVLHSTYEDGCTAWPHTWDNPCGHIDKYRDLIEEVDSAKEIYP